MSETERAWHALVEAWAAYYAKAGQPHGAELRAVMRAQRRLYQLAPAVFASLDRAAHESARVVVESGRQSAHVPSPADSR
jgi:hypothetical protein